MRSFRVRKNVEEECVGLQREISVKVTCLRRCSWWGRLQRGSASDPRVHSARNFNVRQFVCVVTCGCFMQCDAGADEISDRSYIGGNQAWLLFAM